MNNSIPNIPVSELTPENIDLIKSEASEPMEQPTHEKKPKNKTNNHRLLLLIVGLILLIGVGIALYFILRPAPTSDTDAEESAEIIWTPSADADNSGQEYINNKQATIDNAATTTDEKLKAELDIANLYSATNRYTEAETLLNSIARESLTHRQLFNLYSAYAYLYNHSGNETAYKEYSALVDQELDTYWGEEESSEAAKE